MKTAIEMDSTPQSANGRSTMLKVDSISKQYNTGKQITEAIKEISFGIKQGELVTILGPSGCGKTTLMNCLGGLLSTTTGGIYLDGRQYSKPPEGLSIVFQDYSRSLFPWLTVADNIAVPIKGEFSRAETRENVDRILERVKLPLESADKYPWQLSGGMQQRVSIARALIARPKVMLMDEPFASVDAQTKNILEDLTLDLWSEWKKTILFVTHDIDEAVYLSDRVIVLSARPSTVVAEVEVPLERPRNQLVSRKDPRFNEIRGQLYEMIMSANT